MRVLRGNPGLAALVAGAISTCDAQEIAPFRLTGMEGYVGVRAVNDQLTTRSGNASGSGLRTRQAQSDLREEVFVMTHSYVYHPNLATLDIGGGPIFQQGSFGTDTGDTSSRATLYNFTARASFLRDKPYQGGVFFEHLNPAVSVAPGQILTQQNEQYGMSFAVLEPATPVPVRVDATHAHFRGTSTDRFIDDQVDRFSLRASRSFGALGSTQLQYQATDQTSQSGNPNLPIQHSSSRNQGLNVDSRFQLGARRQYDLVNLLSFNTQSFLLEQGSLPERRDMRFLLDARARHSEQLQTFALYSYSSSVQGDLSSISRASAAGLTYWLTPELSTSAGGRIENTDSTLASTRLRGVDGAVRYSVPLAAGELQTSYTARLDQREQRAATSTGNVIGERIVLTGIAFVTLTRQHVTPGSIVVSSVTRTQTYLEGVDYTVTVVGADTRLQRVVGGNIVDGQALLVDYQFDVGGTFAYRQQDQAASLNWSYRGVFNAYLRHLESTPTVTSGEPTFPLNHIRSDIIGARADVPLRLRLDMLAGGFIEREDRVETISPFQRSAQEGYVQSEEPISGGSVRLGLRRTRVEYPNSAQGVDLHAYDIRYWSRRLWGFDLVAEVSRETDSGGTVSRRRDIASVKSLWVYRKVRVSFDLGRTRETQGPVERTRSGGRLLMRRDF